MFAILISYIFLLFGISPGIRNFSNRWKDKVCTEFCTFNY